MKVFFLKESFGRKKERKIRRREGGREEEKEKEREKKGKKENPLGQQIFSVKGQINILGFVGQWSLSPLF